MQKPRNELESYKYCPNCKTDLILQKIDNEEREKCNKYGFIFWNNPKPVVRIIISNS
ncbi:MAG: hypothetical protein Q7K55_04105 [Candidatus Levybacteria bacterium]|nr:hypothetical protein [Candidatus Levybacteria bacterium]